MINDKAIRELLRLSKDDHLFVMVTVKDGTKRDAFLYEVRDKVFTLRGAIIKKNGEINLTDKFKKWAMENLEDN